MVLDLHIFAMGWSQVNTLHRIKDPRKSSLPNIRTPLGAVRQEGWCEAVMRQDQVEEELGPPLVRDQDRTGPRTPTSVLFLAF